MLKVLLVEDNRIFREAFKENLQQRFPAMVIEEVEGGDQALQRIIGTSFQLIFSDIQLGGMNGLQLTRKIKEDFPGVHVAILTGYDLPEYREAALQHGADRLFVKEAVNWDELSDFVNSIPFC